MLTKPKLAEQKAGFAHLIDEQTCGDIQGSETKRPDID
jgi:hypothetical protein